jgi:hypothetical protein
MNGVCDTIKHQTVCYRVHNGIESGLRSVRWCSDKAEKVMIGTECSVKVMSGAQQMLKSVASSHAHD